MRILLALVSLALLPTLLWLLRLWIIRLMAARRRRPRHIRTGTGFLTVRPSADGAYRVRSTINGAVVDLVIDTGASTTTLNVPAAERAGLKPDLLTYDIGISTANGNVPNAAAEVVLDDIRIGPISVTGLSAQVSRAPLDENLLGLDFLKSLTSFEIRDGDLQMRQ
jgi:aspartyl protease family protein